MSFFVPLLRGVVEFLFVPCERPTVYFKVPLYKLSFNLMCNLTDRDNGNSGDMKRHFQSNAQHSFLTRLNTFGSRSLIFINVPSIYCAK